MCGHDLGFEKTGVLRSELFKKKIIQSVTQQKARILWAFL
jgi:hypothetical protein